MAKIETVGTTEDKMISSTDNIIDEFVSKLMLTNAFPREERATSILLEHIAMLKSKLNSR